MATWRQGGHSAAVLSLVWCLLAVVFIHGYIGTLMAFLSVPKLKPVIGELEDLPKSRLDWYVRRGTDLESLFLVIIILKLFHSEKLLLPF